MSQNDFRHEGEVKVLTLETLSPRVSDVGCQSEPCKQHVQKQCWKDDLVHINTHHAGTDVVSGVGMGELWLLTWSRWLQPGGEALAYAHPSLLEFKPPIY